MTTTARPRLLVKTRAGRELPERSFTFGSRSFKVEPLFSRPAARGGFSLAGEARWYVVEAAEELDEEKGPWDFAYEALEERFGFAAGDAPELIEPDVLHEWPYENPTPLLARGQAFSAKEACIFNDQDLRGGATPEGPGFGWFLKDDFSQLRSAREQVGTGKRQVRIAHVDTGYDPGHVTRPKNLSEALQRNFVQGEDEKDARDPARRGLLKNPGHGTGTLSILAGNVLDGVPHSGDLKGLPLGGAPEAEIVPLRVANSVVHFFTSAVARAFEYLTSQGCDVVSMSMGGVPSSAWTEAVNRAYEAGVVMVCAAGNNYGRFPTRFLVYPARYRRVLAACGVMANGKSYSGLPIKVMQGNWGPRRAMRTALSAYTPNMPWAEIGCTKIVDMDGAGTSSATPQVAAAAALWLMHHDPRYSQPWMKVEAVRKALFDSARDPGARRLGRGILQARAALAVQPVAEGQLEKTKEDSARFPFLRVLTGLGASQSRRTAMLELEAAQLLQRSAVLERLFADNDVDPDGPPSRIPPKLRKELAEALAEDPSCSRALREHLGQEVVRKVRPLTPVEIELAQAPPVPSPTTRRLRAFSFDPSLGLELETAMLNETLIEIPWEELGPGPVGAYLEVVDVDPPSGCAYAPVNLDEPRILARQGLSPSEGNPQFHQQMVYAVAMKTIQNFERALGRVALWSPRTTRKLKAEGGMDYSDVYVPRLRIYPHALRQANAFYSPERKALLFGYFPASRRTAGRGLPGGMVFTCLSHDVIAHETTHALLDGLHRRFAEPSNPDVYAFHEAFADIVALFQHFSFPEALRHQIEKTRGDLSRQNLLGQLAQQFGEALGGHGALRDALGEVDAETGEWRPQEPDPEAFRTVFEPHDRGAILVAAVFDAFLIIYKHRSRDLLRLATGGSGVLPEGAISPDLAGRLAQEAAKAAQHVLTICIRALDYCPPVDITFGEYLRALITADSDLVPDDTRHYRVAFIEAFRRRGIYPGGVRTLSVESLRWRSPESLQQLDGLDELLEDLELGWDLSTERLRAYRQSQKNCAIFHGWARDHLFSREGHREEMGLAWEEPLPTYMRPNDKGEAPTEVHSVRPARRLAPDGSFITELVVEITQRRRVPRGRRGEKLGSFQFRGGCTLLIDLQRRKVRYCIKKDIYDDDRLERQKELEVSPGSASLRATYFGNVRRREKEPFALLHSAFPGG